MIYNNCTQVTHSITCMLDDQIGMKGLIQHCSGRWRGQVNVNGKMYVTRNCATKYKAALAYNSLCMERDLPLRRNTLEAVNALKP